MTDPSTSPNEQSGGSDDASPRERCPYCGELVEVESADPLEEYCINGTCDYYRAEMADGRVMQE